MPEDNRDGLGWLRDLPLGRDMDLRAPGEHPPNQSTVAQSHAASPVWVPGAIVDTGEVASAPVAPRPGVWRSIRRGVSTAMTLLVLVGAGYVTHGALASPGGLFFDAEAATPPVDPNRPTPGVGAALSPIGTPPPAPTAPGEFGFVATQADGVTPVAYDPCRAIHYVIRPDNAPAGGQATIEAAFTRISAATGLRFVYDGETQEDPSPQRPSYQPGRYGDRWAPVLIAWTSEAENPEFAADLAGQAGSASAALTGGPTVFVTGMMELDVPTFDSLRAQPGGAELTEAIVMHEAGHLVGLDHVQDPTELMYPEARFSVTDFGPGDLAGLSALGAGACDPDL